MDTLFGVSGWQDETILEPKLIVDRINNKIYIALKNHTMDQYILLTKILEKAGWKRELVMNEDLMEHFFGYDW
ncbi:hypothetical protein C4565_10030 [Candidatus Parcubacteria bacterium]|nr:MAG: hypothetical protein C4565_10030 [Candidatus Parcubacteria bacterium]